MVGNKVNTSLQIVQSRFSPALRFGRKVMDDGITQFAGMLAYSLMLSIAPLLVGIAGLVGFFYFVVTGHTSQDVIKLLTAHVATLPINNLTSTLTAIQHEAGTVSIIGIVVAFFAGAGFFQNVDYAFSIILRLKQRDFIHEWIMSLGMVFILIPLITVSILATFIPQGLDAIVSFLHPEAAPLNGFIVWLLSLVGGFLAAFLLFITIYMIVPNQWVPFKDAYSGALLAGALLELYTLLFPFYAGHFLNPNNYGANFGFVLVIIVFFYYFAIILLIGMEFNSWLLGKCAPEGALPELLHDLSETSSC
jgi:YihY family inner membrane protein